MLPVLSWIDKHTFEDEADVGSTVYDLAFKPDGSQLLAAIGTRVVVYNPNDGSVVVSLKGHRDLVYSVDFSYTGERYASGSQDRSVIVWSEQHEGLLKYSHDSPIQKLAFSPVSTTLISCAVTDFGIWSQNEKSVSKQKVHAKCTSCAWSCDGQYFAIGFFDGVISVRSPNISIGEEITRVERPGHEPIWSLQFQNVVSSNTILHESLVVGDWDQSVAFYQHESGRLVHKSDKKLDYDPMAAHLFNNGTFFLAIGSNKRLNLHTREGGDLGPMAHLDALPWSMAFRQKPYCVVVGCIDGSIAMWMLMLNTIHALHRDRYAYRENQTEVVVQHLQRQKSTRIRCNDLVRKISVYNNRLAVQLMGDRIYIYKQISGDRDGEPLEYKMMERINQNFECSLLVVCTHHLILCNDQRLACYDFKGIKQREWTMESLIRYIKVIGGPPGQETILIGMGQNQMVANSSGTRNGLVSKIFVDNPFPVEVLRLKSLIRCVDISLSKRKLATVDEDGVLVIYDTEKKEILSQEPNVSSVAFNSENEDLIAYAGNGVISIKLGLYSISFIFSHKLFVLVRSSRWQPFVQPLEPSQQGFVVGFMGKCVYILHMYSMHCIEIPLTSQLLQYIDKKMFKEAYALACLGVTEHDWKMLGTAALENLDFEVAKKSLFRVKDTRALILVNELTEMRSRGSSVDEIRALLYAYNKRFRECVQLFQKMGQEQRALEMFSDLRMFDQAQEFLVDATAETQKLLLRKKADWAQISNDQQMLSSVPDMLMASGDFDKAIKLMMANGWVEKVANAVRKVDRSEANLIREVGQFMARRGEFTIASQIFQRINDLKSIIAMHVQAGNWDDAFAIASRYPTMVEEVYLPYARWLAERDRFEEAQIAYCKANHQQEANEVLGHLALNAVQENRYNAASFYYRRMASKMENRAASLNVLIKRHKKLTTMADVYYAYEPLFKYVVEPFTDKSADILFQMARFVVLHPTDINYVSRVIALYTLMKLARKFGNYKTARQALDQLRLLRTPPQYQSLIDVATLEIRAKPFADADEYQPMCFNCGTSNPILGGHECVHCGNPFVYSFITFEVLPLLEFELDEQQISDASEAVELINAEPPGNPMNVNEIAMNKKRKSPLRFGREELLSVQTSEVFVCNSLLPMKTKFFLKVIPQIKIVKCAECNKFFHPDDFQLQILRLGHCPVCRVASSGKFDAILETQNESEFNNAFEAD